MAHEGDFEQQLRELLREHPHMPRTDMAQLLGVSRKTLYKHLGRIGDSSTVAQPAPKPDLSKSDSRAKLKGAPPGNKNALGNKGGHGGPPGNAKAVTTGAHVNPFLRALLPLKDAELIEAERPANEAEALQRSIDLYAARLEIQLSRLRKLEEQKQRMVVFEASYTRQEGDGELMGTGRIATRKRRSVDEEIRRQHAVIDRTQRLYDSAVKAKHDMTKGAPPTDANAGMNALAANIKASAELLAKQTQQAQAGGEQP